MNINIARVWKDREYRESLSAEELALVPANPIGQIELTEEDMADVVGGTLNSIICTAGSGSGCNTAGVACTIGNGCGG